MGRFFVGEGGGLLHQHLGGRGGGAADVEAGRKILGIYFYTAEVKVADSAFCLDVDSLDAGRLAGLAYTRASLSLMPQPALKALVVLMVTLSALMVLRSSL